MQVDLKTHRVEYVADGPELQGEGGEGVQDGGVEALHKLKQVGAVPLQLRGVGQPCGVHLVVPVVGLHQLLDERPHHRLQVVHAKHLEGAGEDLAGYGVAAEQRV